MAKAKPCLWLDGQKIYNIRALREHFDVSVLIGYFIGGGLERWLAEIGENAVLERVRCIDRTKNLAEQLAFAFGVRPEPREAVMINLPALEKGAQVREQTAKLAESEDNSKKSPEILPKSSFIFKSSFFGSFYGSFGSFRGSFGSFRGSFGSFGGAGNLHTELVCGSFRYFAGAAEITQTEYKKTMINLSSCPLNRYGYGINLI